MLTWPFRSKESVPAPSQPVDLAALSAPPDRLRITWLGHSSAYVQTPSASILLDPMTAERASPLSFLGPRRFVPFPVDVAALPGVDLVLYSHDHYDHLDPRTVQVLADVFDPLFVVPLGVDREVTRMGARRTVALDWWQRLDIAGHQITCTPARHFSGRSLFNRNATLWAGWHVEAPGATLFYAGDTGWGSHVGEIREAFSPPDVALVPIGAYEPRWFMEEVHVTPSDALELARHIRARHLIPVHYGTFDLADEPLDAPLRSLRDAYRPGDPPLYSLAVGETWTLP